MRLPFVSAAMHREVIAAKDETIATLRAQIVALEGRLNTPVAVSVSLPQDFAVIQPAIVQSPARKGKRQQQQDTPGALSDIELADIDENDNQALARLAVKYLGGRKARNAWELNHVVSTVRQQIVARKQMLARESLKKLAQQDPPPTPARAEEPEASSVPIHVREMIEKAERGE